MSSSTTADAVFAAALGLPLESRAALAEKLLKSLDSPDRNEIDAAWAHEAERRIEAFEDGRMPAEPMADVLKELRAPNGT
jgi:putative addiction module component (TIGR02574 family)